MGLVAEECLRGESGAVVNLDLPQELRALRAEHHL